MFGAEAFGLPRSILQHRPRGSRIKWAEGERIEGRGLRREGGGESAGFVAACEIAGGEGRFEEPKLGCSAKETATSNCLFARARLQ